MHFFFLVCLEEQSICEGETDMGCQEDIFLEAPSFLLSLSLQAGGDAVVEAEIGRRCQIHKQCNNVLCIRVVSGVKLRLKYMGSSFQNGISCLFQCLL